MMRPVRSVGCTEAVMRPDADHERDTTTAALTHTHHELERANRVALLRSVTASMSTAPAHVVASTSGESDAEERRGGRAHPWP